MKIEETFDVDAPVDKTWAFLNDIPAVLPCMPGAELAETRGSDEWVAVLAAKVGPMAMKFDVDVNRTKSDESSRVVVLDANAREVKGRGRATATIESSLDPIDGGTRVNIVTDLQMQGKVAQLGGSVVKKVSSKMTKQFAENLAAELTT